MISVCMPTYNGSMYIKEQLDSIIQQISDNDEIIISDDSSTDNTIEVIKNYNDSRIVLLEGNTFHSPIYNLENALKAAKGDFIFLSDQDDIWYPNKVSIIMELLKSNSCVVSDATIINSDKEILFNSFMELNKSKEGIIKNLVKNSYIGCCMAFDRSILMKALPFPEKLPMHDLWIGLMAEKYGNSLFYKEPLIYYRRHGNNSSTTGEKSNLSFKQKVINRVIYIKEFLKR